MIAHAGSRAHRSLVATRDERHGHRCARRDGRDRLAGYTAQRLDLGDGVGVGRQRRAAGRSAAPTPRCSSSTRSCAATSADLEVVQYGATVLLVDRRERHRSTSSTRRPPSRRQRRRFRPTQPQVYLAGRPRRHLRGRAPASSGSCRSPTLRDFDADSAADPKPRATRSSASTPDGLLVRLLARRPSRSTASTPTDPTTVERQLALAIDADARRADHVASAAAGRCSTPRTRTAVPRRRTIDLTRARRPRPGAPSLQLPAPAADRVLDRPPRRPARRAARRRSRRALVERPSGAPRRAARARRLRVRRLERRHARGATAPDGDPGSTSPLDESRRRGPRVLVQRRPRRAQRPPQRRGLGGAAATASSSTTGTTSSQRGGRAGAVEENDDDNPPEIEQEQQPPVAVDDEFGARPGRATLLPVLLNDYDPNGDVLVITEVSADRRAIGRLDLVDAQPAAAADARRRRARADLVRLHDHRRPRRHGDRDRRP